MVPKGILVKVLLFVKQLHSTYLQLLLSYKNVQNDTVYKNSRLHQQYQHSRE